MYVVKKAFRSYGVLYTPGTIITDTTKIKLFKCKVGENKIVVVPDEPCARRDELCAYFAFKTGKPFPPVVKAPVTKSVVETTKTPIPPTPVKPVVKAAQPAVKKPVAPSATSTKK